MNHSKGIFIHICVWLGAEKIEKLIWIHSYRKVNLIIVALGQAWRESHLTLMNNLKYKGLVIPAVRWTEEKRFSWEKTAEKLSHSDPKKQGKTGLVQEEVRRKYYCTNEDPLNYLTPKAGSTRRLILISRCELWGGVFSPQNSPISCSSSNVCASPHDAAWNSNAEWNTGLFSFVYQGGTWTTQWSTCWLLVHFTAPNCAKSGKVELICFK